MSYGFKVIVEGDYACFTRPEMKSERVSYDVPPPGALEGLLKGVYWKPAIRYVIDKIIIFNPINFVSIRRNEVENKVSLQKMKSQMNQKGADPCIYTAEERSQRSAMVLKNVKYGIEFHFELTHLKSEREIGEGEESKHYHIIKRRLDKGQCFRMPCLGCSEFPIKSITPVEEFNLGEIHDQIMAMGDVDLGFMSYKVCFNDKGIPQNNDWSNPIFSDKAVTAYYRPHMISGVIDVEKYREVMKC